MAVEYSLFFVDWEDFSKKAATAPDPYEFMEATPHVQDADDAFSGSMEVIETVDSLRGTYYRDAEPEGFLQRLIRKLDERLTASSEAFPEIEKLDQFLSHLFWGWRDKSCQIMELEVALEMMEVAMSPPTVKEYAALFGDIRFDKIEPRYRKFGVQSKLGEYEDFVSFCRQWGSLVQRCASGGKGLLIYTYG